MPTSNHNTSIKGLRPNHFLRIHAHEIPQEHTRWTRKAFCDANGREVNRKSTSKLYPALRSLHELRRVAMAGIEARIRIYNADYGAGERIFAVAEGFDEDFAKEKTEVSVAIGCETLS